MYGEMTRQGVKVTAQEEDTDESMRAAGKGGVTE